MRKIPLLLFLFHSLAAGQVDCFDRSDTCKYSVSALSLGCPSCGSNSPQCKVIDFGLLGTVDGLTYYYGLYSTDVPDIPDSLRDSLRVSSNQNCSLEIFEGKKSDGTAMNIWELGASSGEFSLTPPTFAKTKNGTAMQVVMKSVNGKSDVNFYFLRTSGAWKSVDAPDWTEALRRYVPSGMHLCGAGTIDFDQLIMSVPLFKAQDQCCCPTGGYLGVRLEIQSDKFIVESVEYHSHGS